MDTIETTEVELCNFIESILIEPISIVDQLDNIEIVDLDSWLS